MADNTPPLATITQQQETVQPDATGHVVQGMRVYFQTAKGVSSSIFVAKTEFSKDTVTARVKDAAAQLDSIQGAEIR